MNVFDKDGSGFLDREVLEYSIRNLGDGLNQREIEEFVASIKYDENGKIGYDDFMRIVYNEKPAQERTEN
jgi:Ca2+-binding EF-hand superfamily protein